jgi:hypothetical protein
MSGTSISTTKGVKKDEKRLISSLFAVNASVSGKHLVSLTGLSWTLDLMQPRIIIKMTPDAIWPIKQNSTTNNQIL